MLFKRKTICPDFYDSFECRVSACEHTCCAGWEIDVDDATADYYYKVKGEFGDELVGSIREDSEGFHFIMKDNKCPFLDDQGLCRIIKTLDEDALCDICALHPRFFSSVKKFDLCGLGLSCEAVCGLLLSAKKPLVFVEEPSGFSYTLSGLLSLLNIDFAEGALDYSPSPEGGYYSDLINAFSDTEAIDEAWTSEMNILKVNAKNISERARRYARTYDSIAYNRIFSYILYRQIELAADYGIDAVISYAKSCTEFVFLTDALWGDTADKLRRFSEQIEYSTTNVRLLIGKSISGIDHKGIIKQ